MKNLQFWFLCFSFTTVIVFKTEASNKIQNQTWDELVQVDFKSVKSATENCQKVLNYAETRSKSLINKITYLVQRCSTYSNVPPRIWKTVTEAARILKRTSKKLAFQIDDLGDYFLKRLSNIIDIANKSSKSIVKKLQTIYESSVHEVTETGVEIERLFNDDYNPSQVLQHAVHKSINNNGDVDEMKDIAVTELGELLEIIQNEIYALQETSLKLFNKLYKGLYILKELYFTIKSTEGYPSKWSEEYINETLLECVQLAKIITPDRTMDTSTDKEDQFETAQGEADTEAGDDVQTKLNYDADIIQSETDLTQSLEESSEQLNHEDRAECAKIFSLTKKKLLKLLMSTIKEMKSMKDVKELDSQTYSVLHQFSTIFKKLDKKTSDKIGDFARQFIKLYKVIMTIVNRLNAEMRIKMDLIYENRGLNIYDSYHANIVKYFSQTYFSDTKVTELYEHITNSIKLIRNKTEMQKSIINELSVVTNELGFDIETMEKTTAYILRELQKGVAALQNIRNNCDITGVRYYFNYYMGEKDLEQLKKIINIINILNMNELIEREQTDSTTAHNRSILKRVRTEILNVSEKFTTEINEASIYNLREIITNNVNEYNVIVQKYSADVRKIIKRIVTTYLAIYEEIVTIVQKKKVKNSDMLEEILYLNESTQYNEIVQKYLIETSSIDIEKNCDTHFTQELSSEHQLKEIIKEISRFNEAIDIEITAIDKTVIDIINIIRTETKTLENIKIHLEQSEEDLEITDKELETIRSTIQIINLLQMNVGKIDSINECLEEAKDRVKSITSTTEEELKDLTTKSQVQTQMEITSTDLKEIVSSTFTEIYENLKKCVKTYTETLDTVLQSRSDLAIQISNYQLNEKLSDNTGNYIKGNQLNEIIDINQSSDDIEIMKSNFLQSLCDIKVKLDTELVEVQAEITKIVQKLINGIETIQQIESENVVTDENLLTLKTASYWADILKQSFIEDTVATDMDDIHTAVKETCRAIIEECEKTAEIITSTDNTEMLITKNIDTVETMYKSLIYNIRTRVNEHLLEFITNYDAKMTSLKEQHTEETNIILQNFSNTKTNFLTEKDTDYQKFINFTNTKFKIRDVYEHIQTTENAYKVRTFATDVNDRINTMEEIVQYIMSSLETSTEILQMDITTLNTDQIQQLIKTQSIAQLICNKIQNQTNINFSQALDQIKTEYQRAINTIEHSDESNIQQLTSISVENFASSYNSIRKTVEQAVNQSSTTFMQTYEQSKIVLENKNFVNNTEYIKFKSFVTSDSYQTSLAVQNLYKNIQKPENLTKETSIKQIQTLNTEINQRINEMQTMTEYIITNLQKGTQILETINSTILNSEQAQQIERCICIAQTISESSTVYLVVNFTNAKSKIEEECAYITKSLESLDKQGIQESINKTVESYSNIYNKVKEEVLTKIDQSSSTFEQNYQKIINTNEHISSTFQAIANGEYKFESNEQYTQFESFISSEWYQSSSLIETFYETVHNTNSSETLNQRSLNEVKELSIQVNKQLDAMDEVSAYIVSNLSKGTDILQAIQNESKLSQEQIKQLATSVHIKQALSNVSSTLRTRDHSSLIDFSNTIREINKYSSNAIETIETSDDNYGIQQELAKNIQYYESIYNSIQQTTIEKFSQITTDLVQHYDQIVTNAETKGNSKTSAMLQNIISSDYSTKEYQKLISIIETDATSFVHNLYKYIETTENVKDIKQKSINEVKALNTQVLQHINNIEEIMTYVTENSEKGAKILQVIENNLNVELTEEQITQLTKSINIAKTINTHTTTESTSLWDTVVSYITKDTIATADFTATKTEINDEYANAVQYIETLQDEHTIWETVNSSVQKYKKIYNNICAEVKQQVDQCSNNFMHDYQQVKRDKIEIYLQQTENLLETDAEYQNFISYISNNSYKTSSTVNNLYENIHSTQNISVSVKEQSIHELQLLKNKVNQQLDKMDQVTAYITTNLQHGSKILKTIESIQLETEQVKQLIKSIHIVEAVNTHTSIENDSLLVWTTGNETNDYHIADSSVVQNKINNEYMNFIESISDLYDEESIIKAVSTIIKNYDTIYNKETENIKIEIEQASTTFMQTYHQLESNIVIQNDFNKEYNIEADTEYQKFISNISGKNVVQTLFENLQTKENSSEDYTKKAINQVKALSTEFSNYINELDIVSKYVSENLKKGAEILHLLETHTELNQQQSEQLKKSLHIAQKGLEILQTFDKETIELNEEQGKQVTKSPLIAEVLNAQSLATNSKTIESKNVTEDVVNTDQQETDSSSIEEEHVLNTIKDTVQKLITVENEDAETDSITTQHNVNVQIGSTAEIVKTEHTDTKLQLAGKPYTNSEYTTNVRSLDTLKEKSNESPYVKIESQENIENSAAELQYETTSRDTNLQTSATMETIGTVTEINTKSMYDKTDIFPTGNHQNLIDSNIEVQETNEKISTTTESHNEENNTKKTGLLSNFLSALTVDDTSDLSSEEKSTDTRTCTSTSNILQVSLRSKNKEFVDAFTLDDLLIQQEMTSSTNWTSTSQSLNWNNNDYVVHQEDKLAIEEIVDIFTAAREVTRQVTEISKIKLKLYRHIDDILAIFVLTVDRFNEIIQQLSYVIEEQIQNLYSTYMNNLKEYMLSNKELQSEPSALDEQFIKSIKSFIALSYSSKTNLLSIVEKEFTQYKCNTIEKSKSVVVEKFEKLQSITSTILMNVNLVTLTAVDIVINAKMSLENLKNKSFDEGNTVKILNQKIKNSENLYNILNNVEN